MDHLESFIAECDRRTELAKKRLAETQEEISAEVAAKVFLWCSCALGEMASLEIHSPLTGCCVRLLLVVVCTVDWAKPT